MDIYGPFSSIVLKCALKTDTQLKYVSDCVDIFVYTTRFMFPSYWEVRIDKIHSWYYELSPVGYLSCIIT